MKTYKVTYVETLVHAFYVEANSEEEAAEAFHQGLMDDAFDLSDGDVTSSDYTIKESEDEYHFHYKMKDATCSTVDRKAQECAGLYSDKFEN